MLRDLTPQAAYMGALASFIGYAASFAIVLSAIEVLGATPAQAATGLFFATMGMALGSIWLPWITRTPAAVAWSTPGAAFLIASGGLPGGFSEAVGALIMCSALIVLSGFIPVLGRAVAAIPKPIANALLAGVILNLCLAPALALAEIPWLVLPVMVAWLIGLTWTRLAAMPFAVAAFVAVLILGVDIGDMGGRPVSIGLPEIALVAPTFTLGSFISLSVPLYLVTMAGQNIPGFAVLELHEYKVNRPQALRATGALSLAFSPFGSVPVNMSAITAAMMVGEDAGPDPAGRYWAGVISGVVHFGLAFAASAVVAFASLAPTALITTVAGLALIPALVSSIAAAFNDPKQLEAPALTFLIVASGMTLLGVSGAVWGIVVGVVVWAAKAARENLR